MISRAFLAGLLKIFWRSNLKSLIVDFFTLFIHEKTPQNNFSRQNIGVENNYLSNVKIFMVDTLDSREA